VTAAAEHEAPTPTPTKVTARLHEAKPRFGYRRWDECEMTNGMRLQASEPPIPEHLQQIFAQPAMPEKKRAGEDVDESPED
jgi:hypothetical protein